MEDKRFEKFYSKKAGNRVFILPEEFDVMMEHNVRSIIKFIKSIDKFKDKYINKEITTRDINKTLFMLNTLKHYFSKLLREYSKRQRKLKRIFLSCIFINTISRPQNNSLQGIRIFDYHKFNNEKILTFSFDSNDFVMFDLNVIESDKDNKSKKYKDFLTKSDFKNICLMDTITLNDILEAYTLFEPTIPLKDDITIRPYLEDIEYKLTDKIDLFNIERDEIAHKIYKGLFDLKDIIK